MILNTSDNLQARRRTKALEEQRQKTKEWISNETKNAQFLDDPKNNPLVAASRLGSPLHSDTLEAKLKKLNNNLLFEYNIFNSTKKMVYLVDSRGKMSLFPYEAGVMPERSVMEGKIERVPNPDMFNNSHFVLNRKDFNKSGENPYVKEVLVPWREKVRGWRTVLIKLVKEEILTPEQVEREFGVHNSPEWQNHMGKAAHLLPW